MNRIHSLSPAGLLTLCVLAACSGTSGTSGASVRGGATGVAAGGAASAGGTAASGGASALGGNAAGGAAGSGAVSGTLVNPVPGAKLFVGVNFWRIEWEGVDDYFRAGLTLPP